MNDLAIPLSQLVEQTAQKFQRHFGRAPRWIAAAPGRVNVIGEHTDYNDGFVLPMAIERYTVVAANSASRVSPGAKQVNWHCARTNQTAAIPLSKPVPRGEPKHWTNYVRGVLAEYQARGTELEPLDVLMDSTVPLGSGLSSSAALEISTATLVEAVTGRVVDPVEKALLCQKAEHEYVGMPCGIMDQFISTMGKKDHLLLLDCRSRQTQLVPMNDPEVSVLITNTKVKHELVGGEYAQRRKQCETAARILEVPALRDATLRMLEAGRGKMESIVFQRARHVIGEIARTTSAAASIGASDWPMVGHLMYASHASLRDDYAVSCAELDEVVAIAQRIGPQGGVIGCRMTGGGFGGCTVALVRTSAVPGIIQKISADYQARTGIEPALFVSRPAAGAAIIQA